MAIKKITKSSIEDMLFYHIKAVKLPTPLREYRFHDDRKWRFDFAYPQYMLAIEVEGITHYGKNADGTMKLGRHQTGKGIEADLEKYQAAMLLGWNVYRCSGRMIKSGEAIQTIETLLGMIRDGKQ